MNLSSLYQNDPSRIAAMKVYPRRSMMAGELPLLSAVHLKASDFPTSSSSSQLVAPSQSFHTLLTSSAFNSFLLEETKKQQEKEKEHKKNVVVINNNNNNNNTCLVHSRIVTKSSKTKTTTNRNNKKWGKNINKSKDEKDDNEDEQNNNADENEDEDDEEDAANLLIVDNDRKRKRLLLQFTSSNESSERNEKQQQQEEQEEEQILSRHWTSAIGKQFLRNSTVAVPTFVEVWIFVPFDTVVQRFLTFLEKKKKTDREEAEDEEEEEDFVTFALSQRPALRSRLLSHLIGECSEIAVTLLCFPCRLVPHVLSHSSSSSSALSVKSENEKNHNRFPQTLFDLCKNEQEEEEEGKNNNKLNLMKRIHKSMLLWTKDCKIELASELPFWVYGKDSDISFQDPTTTTSPTTTTTTTMTTGLIRDKKRRNRAENQNQNQQQQQQQQQQMLLSSPSPDVSNLSASFSSSSPPPVPNLATATAVTSYQHQQDQNQTKASFFGSARTGTQQFPSNPDCSKCKTDLAQRFSLGHSSLPVTWVAVPTLLNFGIGPVWLERSRTFFSDIVSAFQQVATSTSSSSTTTASSSSSSSSSSKESFSEQILKDCLLSPDSEKSSIIEKTKLAQAKSIIVAAVTLKALRDSVEFSLQQDQHQQQQNWRNQLKSSSSSSCCSCPSQLKVRLRVLRRKEQQVSKEMMISVLKLHACSQNTCEENGSCPWVLEWEDDGGTEKEEGEETSRSSSFIIPRCLFHVRIDTSLEEQEEVKNGSRCEIVLTNDPRCKIQVLDIC